MVHSIYILYISDMLLTENRHATETVRYHTIQCYLIIVQLHNKYTWCMDDCTQSTVDQ